MQVNDMTAKNLCDAALSNAKIIQTGLMPPGGCWRTPMEMVNEQIAHVENQVKWNSAKLDTLYAIRAKLLSDPETAKAIQDALELLR